MFSMTQNELHHAVQGALAEATTLRRALHQHPEPRFQEQWTSERLAERLTASGVSVKRGYCGGTGLVGEIKGEGDRVIALRADMDALELEEKSGAHHASTIPGRMHACGHDGHMAMLWAAAHILAQCGQRPNCTVRFIFQPAEEMGRGGAIMAEEGILDGAAAVFGMHCWPDLPLGKVGLKSGYAMAGADWFRIRVQGKGCHGADPAAGVDPIVAAAHVVLALQNIVSRELDPREAAVVSVGRIQAGEVENSIPDAAEMAGTFRTLSPETREKVRAAIVRTASGAAQMQRATAAVEFNDKAYIPLYNDPDMCVFALQAIRDGLGEDAALLVERPSMASEDFAFYLQRVPGAMLWLGMGRGTESAAPLHSPCFDFNDDVLAPGIGAWLSLVRAFERAEPL